MHAARRGAPRRRRCCRSITSAALVALGALAGAQPAPALNVERPNIILVVADDLGYGDLGCYGQERVATPHLDQLAAEGMRFTQFYAGSPVCAPSRCVLMTGLHTGHAWIRGNSKQNLRPEDVTLGEVLQQAGYTCALMGKWGLGHEGSEGIPNRQGFDEFFGYLDQHHAHNYYPTFLIHNQERFPLENVVPNEDRYGSGRATVRVQYSHDLVVERALDFVRHQAYRPFFLYLAVTIPHANNEAGDEGMEVPDLGRYAQEDWPQAQKGHAAMITRMDEGIGRLMALVRELGIDKKTVVLFTSDNGPHREGGFDPEWSDSNGPLRGIKRSLHEGGIRVPLIASWPGTIPAGATNDWIGGFCDVLPTLAEIAGAGSCVPARLDGISFAPTLRGSDGEQPQHDYLYWAFYERGGGQALRCGPWKAVQQPIASPVRLYNLADDVGEEQDVSAEHPELVAVVERLMQGAYEPNPRWHFPDPNPSLEPVP